MQEKKRMMIEFSSIQDELNYLRKKVAFLEAHAVGLVDLSTPFREHFTNSQLKELSDIKCSRSWRITRPLRQFSFFVNKVLFRFLHKSSGIDGASFY